MPHQGGVDPPRLTALDQFERDASWAMVNRFGLQTRGGNAGKAPDVQRPVRQRGQQFGALGIIQIDDRTLQARPVEQASLGRPVRVHVRVVVQVVLCEVGEHRDINGHAVQSVLFNPDRRRFDRAGGVARLHKQPQLLLQQHRVGCGQAVGHHGPRLTNAQRPDQATATAQTAQGLRQPPGGGGFPIGTGHRSNLQCLAGVVKVSGGNRPSGRFQTGIVGHVVTAKTKPFDPFTLHQARRSATGHCTGHMMATIMGGAWPGNEPVTWCHLTAVGAQAAAHMLVQPLRGLFGVLQGDGQNDSSTGLVTI